MNIYSARYSVAKGWHWHLERAVTEETRAEWLAQFRDDEHGVVFIVADKPPIGVTSDIHHYGETREEKASRLGTHPSCWEHRDTPLCGNGSYHAATTRNLAKVTCGECLKRKGR